MSSDTFSIIYNSKPGFVIRIAMILERRGFEIEHLAVTSSQGGYSEMVLKVKGAAVRSEQIVKQISKLIDVICIEEVKEEVLAG